MTDELDIPLLLDALDSQQDGVLVVDRTGRIRHVSRALLDRFGLTLAQTAGHRIDELHEVGVHFLRNQAAYQLLARVMDDVMEQAIDHVDDDASRIGVDGQPVPCSLRIHAIRRGDEVVGATLNVRDHSAGGSLVFRRAAVGMAHVDRDGKVAETNEALLRMLGRHHDDVRFRSFLDLVHDEDREATALLLDDVLHRREAVHRLEARFWHADGTIRSVDLSMARNGMGGPEFGGACATLQDITERVQLQAELEAAQARLQALAHHDPLTGLPNRAHLDEELSAAQQRAEASGTHVGVLFIDLDGFKQVNDTAGHEAGDRLLVEAGDRLRKLLRPADVAARFGGDEFVLCCTELADDPEQARAAVERIAGRVRDALSAPFVIDDREWWLGASVGIALSLAGADDPSALLRAADADMYRVKSGR